MSTNTYLGFTSTGDFFKSLLRMEDWHFNSVAVIMATITTFITGYIWDSPEAIYTLWTLMAADYVTGIVRSIRNKEFVSNKLFRMPIYFLVTSFTIAISWWLAKGSMLFMPLPSIMYGGFCAVYLVSLCENLGELGLLPKPMVTVLRNRFGLKTLVDKWTREHQEENKVEDK